jgi:hypothetical protein
MFRRTRELEEENERLKEVISEKDNQFGAIITQINKAKTQNIVTAQKYYGKIKELAEIGLDIKK